MSPPVRSAMSLKISTFSNAIPPVRSYIDWTCNQYMRAYGVYAFSAVKKAGDAAGRIMLPCCFFFVHFAAGTGPPPIQRYGKAARGPMVVPYHTKRRHSQT